MPRPLRFADVTAGLAAGTVEERAHSGLYAFTPRMGRTSALVGCPFCGATVEVFTWSFAGGGKRCPCGALFGRTTSYARVTGSSVQEPGRMNLAPLTDDDLLRIANRPGGINDQLRAAMDARDHENGSKNDG